MYDRVLELWNEAFCKPHIQVSNISASLLDQTECHLHPNFIDSVDTLVETQCSALLSVDATFGYCYKSILIERWTNRPESSALPMLINFNQLSHSISMCFLIPSVLTHL